MSQPDHMETIESTTPLRVAMLRELRGTLEAINRAREIDRGTIAKRKTDAQDLRDEARGQAEKHVMAEIHRLLSPPIIVCDAPRAPQPSTHFPSIVLTQDSEYGIIPWLFGFPIYTIDFDGAVRKRRARRLDDGRIITRGIYEHRVGNADGTFPDGYVKRWSHRKTFWA